MNKMRWRFGETNPVCANVASGTLVEIGDLLVLIDGRVYPASTVCAPDPTSMKRKLVESFLGVAMQASEVGSASKIRVATSGVFEFNCANGRYGLGDLVGAIYRDGALASQAVQKASTQKEAIGRVFRQSDGKASSVYVQIRSKIFGWSE